MIVALLILILLALLWPGATRAFLVFVFLLFTVVPLIIGGLSQVTVHGFDHTPIQQESKR